MIIIMEAIMKADAFMFKAAAIAARWVSMDDMEPCPKALCQENANRPCFLTIESLSSLS